MKTTGLLVDRPFLPNVLALGALAVLSLTLLATPPAAAQTPQELAAKGMMQHAENMIRSAPPGPMGAGIRAMGENMKRVAQAQLAAAQAAAAQMAAAKAAQAAAAQVAAAQAAPKAAQHDGLSAVYAPQRSRSELFAVEGGRLAYYYVSEGKWARDGSSFSAVPVGGRIAAVYNPVRQHSEVFFRGADGYIHLYYVGPNGWTLESAAFRGAKVAANSYLSAVYEPNRKASTVFFQGEDNRLHQWYWNGSGWADGVGAFAGSAPVTGAIAAVFEPQRNHVAIYYRGPDGHLTYHYVVNSASWVHDTTSFRGVKVDGPASAVFETHRNHSAVYFRGADGHLHSYYVVVPERGWLLESAKLRGAKITGALTAVYASQRKHTDVVARGADDRLQYWYGTNGEWAHSSGVAPIPVKGRIATVWAGNHKHTEMFYRDASGALQYTHVPAGSWAHHAIPVSGPAGAQAAAVAAAPPKVERASDEAEEEEDAKPGEAPTFQAAGKATLSGAETLIAKIYDFALKPILKKDYATLKGEIDAGFAGLGALIKDPISVAKTLFESAGSATKSAASQVSGALKGVLKQGMEAAQFVIGLPQRLLDKMKKLIWTKDPPTTPLDTRNDGLILAFFKAEGEEIKSFLNGPAFTWLPKGPELDWLLKTSAETLATVATPLIRFLQYLDGKVRAGVRVVIEFAMRGLSNLDEALGKLQLPPMLMDVLKKAADMIGRTVGSVGAYVLKLNPKIDRVVRGVVTALTNSAGALDTAMKAMSETTQALAGSSIANSASASDPALNAAIAKITAKSGTPEYDAAVQGARLTAAQNRYAGAFEMKRDQVEKAIAKILAAMSEAFTSFAQPALEQVAALIKLPIGSAFQALNNLVAKLFSLIPEAGGAISAISRVVGRVAIDLLLDAVPDIVIGVSMEVASDWIKSLTPDVMKLWDDPAKREVLLKGSQALKKFAGIFDAAKAGLDALKAGLDKGVAAMLEGPVMSLLMKKLPSGLGPLVAGAANAALQRIFDPKNIGKKGGFKLDIPRTIAAVLDDVRPKLTAFLKENLERVGPAKPLVSALVGGLDQASAVVLADLKKSGNPASLFKVNVIRKVVANGLRGAQNGLADFLGANVPYCGKAFREGLLAILTEVANVVESDAQASAVFQKGFLGVVSLIARLSHKPLLAFFSCGFEGDRFKTLRAALVPALEEAGNLLSQPEQLKRIVKGGLPAVFGTVLSVLSHPIGVLLAEGLRDHELAGAIAGAVRAAGAKLQEPRFLTTLTKGGLKGALIEIARIAKAPIVRSLAKLVGDDDFKTALDASYDKILAGLTPDALTAGGLLGIVRSVAPEWIRFVMVKGSTWLVQQLPAVKDRLEQTADALANLGGTLAKEKPALLAFSTTLRDAARGATKTALPRFAKSWTACARTLPTSDVMPQVAAAATCLAKAAKDAFNAGTGAAVEAVAEAGEEPAPEASAESATEPSDSPPEDPAPAEAAAPAEETPAEAAPAEAAPAEAAPAEAAPAEAAPAEAAPAEAAPAEAAPAEATPAEATPAEVAPGETDPPSEEGDAPPEEPAPGEETAPAEEAPAEEAPAGEAPAEEAPPEEEAPPSAETPSEEPEDAPPEE